MHRGRCGSRSTARRATSARAGSSTRRRRRRGRISNPFDEDAIVFVVGGKGGYVERDGHLVDPERTPSAAPRSASQLEQHDGAHALAVRASASSALGHLVERDRASSRSGRGRCCPSSAACARNGKSCCGIVSPPCVTAIATFGLKQVALEVDVERAPGRRHADERRRARVGAHPHRVDEARRRGRSPRTRSRRRPVSSRTCATASPPDASTASVAPSSSASASFSGSDVDRDDPRRAARAARPEPRRARRRRSRSRRPTAPSRTGVAQSAAPAPVEKPHASRHACSTRQRVGHLDGARPRARSRGRRTCRSAAPALSSAPSAARCIRRCARRLFEQRRGSPRRHARHESPHGARHAMTTRSPGATIGHAVADLLDDARALVPEQDREPHPPAVRSRRRAGRCGRRPHASTRTCTSLAPGGSSVISSTAGRAPASA